MSKDDINTDPNKDENIDQAADASAESNNAQIEPEATAASEDAPKSPEQAYEEAEQAPPQQPAPRQSQDKQSGGGKGALILAVIAVIIALMALVSVFWMFQQASQGSQVSGKQVDRLERDIEKLDSEVRSVVDVKVAVQKEILEANARHEKQLRTATNRYDQQISQAANSVKQNIDVVQGQMRQTQEQIQNVRQQLASLSATDRQEWLVAEAEYLMRLANQRILMSRDAKGAAEMLRAADTIVKELDDTALHPVRAKIATELAALQVAAEFDVEGVYLRLDGLAKQAEELKLYELLEFEVAEEQKAAAEQDWRDAVKGGVEEAWQKLSSYIRVSNRGEKYEVMIAPDQEAILRYSVRLMFEQAQLSALSGKQVLYERSLTRASEWIRRYYKLDEKSDVIAAEVDQLKVKNVVSETPDITGSLNLLKAYIDKRRWAKKTGA